MHDRDNTGTIDFNEFQVGGAFGSTSRDGGGSLAVGVWQMVFRVCYLPNCGVLGSV